jgi:hypothetical protein
VRVRPVARGAPPAASSAHTTPASPLAAIEQRRALLAVPTNPPEVTVEVADLAAGAATALASGVMPPTPVPGVGDVAFFTDRAATSSARSTSPRPTGTPR